MGEPLSQYDVEQSIANISDLLEDAVVELSQFANKAASCEADYKIAYAKELLRAKDHLGDQQKKPTVSELESLALIGTEDLFRARLIADAQLSVQQERLRTLRARLDALRSLNSNLRAMV